MKSQVPCHRVCGMTWLKQESLGKSVYFPGNPLVSFPEQKLCLRDQDWATLSSLSCLFSAWQPVACPASGQRRKALDFVLSAVSVPVCVFSALSQTLGWLPWAPLPSGVTVELSIPDSW